MSTALATRHPLADELPDDLSYLRPGSAEAERYGCICSRNTCYCSIGCLLHRERAVRERSGRDHRKTAGHIHSAQYATEAMQKAAHHIAECAGVPSVMAYEILEDAETLNYYFRIGAKLLHPDRADDKEAAHEAFIALKKAYDFLRSRLR